MCHGPGSLRARRRCRNVLRRVRAARRRRADSALWAFAGQDARNVKNRIVPCHSSQIARTARAWPRPTWAAFSCGVGSAVGRRRKAARVAGCEWAGWCSVASSRWGAVMTLAEQSRCSAKSHDCNRVTLELARRHEHCSRGALARRRGLGPRAVASLTWRAPWVGWRSLATQSGARPPLAASRSSPRPIGIRGVARRGLSLSGVFSRHHATAHDIQRRRRRSASTSAAPACVPFPWPAPHSQHYRAPR